MEKIKIMYVITGLHTGGAEIVLRDLLSRMNKEKFEPLVVSIVPIGKTGQEIISSGDKVVSLNIRMKWNFLFILWKFLRLVKREKPDIIHSHLFHANFLARLAKIFNKQVKIISTIHNEKIGGRIREFLLKITDSLSDATNTISRNVTQKMIEKKVAPKNRIITIYNGIDINKFYSDPEKGKQIRKGLNIEERSPVLIAVGRLSKAKGFSYLIQAIKDLREDYPDLVLLILGEGEERNNLKTEINKYILENNIFLLGNKDNVADYLNSADFFVSSSLWEGLPTVILEAMACQLPVVATQVGGVEEIVDNESSGFLIKPKGVYSLAKKIKTLNDMPQEKRERMGRRGREIVKEKFSLDTMTNNYQELYLNLCQKMRK